MRKEFEGVGKGGITEVRVNAMSARGGGEGNPVCYFSSRVLIPSPPPPPSPFTTPSNACHTGYKSAVLTSKHKLYVVQLEVISETGRVKTRTRWTREEERTETLSSLLPRAPLSPPHL